MKNITNIAIGGFDGMHLGHMQLFRQLDDFGSIVVINRICANLTPYNFREQYTTKKIFYYELEDIKNLDAIGFLKLLENDFPNLKKIIVGYDFRFGHDAKYDIHDLKKLFKYEVVVIEQFSCNGIAVHSSTIREYLKNGQIKQANKFLGHHYKIKGNMIKGQGLGKTQFVPTINLQITNFLIPKDGIYLSKAYILDKKFNCVVFIGRRATTDNNFAIEVHIFDDFDMTITKDIQIEIEFIQFLRVNRRFDSFEELRQQIKKDIQIAKQCVQS